MAAKLLSKSRYLNGRQCLKLLWYAINQKKELGEPGPMANFVMAQGRAVGEVAHQLYPDGLLLNYNPSPYAHAKVSHAALRERRPLFEAGFLHGRAYAIADILVPGPGEGWELIEVKSSTAPKEEHYLDLSFQAWIYSGAGLKIDKIFLLYLNNSYLRRGGLDPNKLFYRYEVTLPTVVDRPLIPARLEKMFQVIDAATPPEVAVGPHCYSPRECPLISKCWGFLPEQDSIMTLRSGGEKWYDLLERGILRLQDIPADYELSANQRIQVASHRSGQPYIDQPALREFLGRIRYPLFYLDFETMALPVPPYEETSPYENIPFQYVLFKVAKEGEAPERFTYLAEGKVDPRPEILANLSALLGEEGTIIAYNAPYELGCLRRAAERYPQFLPWAEKLDDRFLDLIEPFKKFQIYYPAQQGSTSLKDVLPALTGESYNGLEIAEGGIASAEYARVTFDPRVSAEERQKVRADLERYCELDTAGMIRVVERVKEVV